MVLGCFPRPLTVRRSCEVLLDTSGVCHFGTQGLRASAIHTFRFLSMYCFPEP